MKKFLVILLFVLFAHQSCHATTQYSRQIVGPTLGVTAYILVNCTVTATSTVPFGSITPTTTTGTASTSANSPASGSITVTCPVGTPYAIALGAGTGSGAGNTAGTNRYMTDSGSTATLAYQLYQDLGCTKIWGSDTTKLNASGGALLYVGTKAANEALTVYGKITDQNMTPGGGNYTDNVTVTLYY